MKSTHYLFILLVTLALAAGCYDDDKLWKAVHEQQQRIEALETWQKTANSNISALQALVSGKHFITDVTPVVLAGDTVGYTVAFHDRTPVTLYHGAKGEQGEQGESGTTPAISIRQEADGNWYWTLNGALMQDDAGQPVRANGEEGKPSPTPVLKTGQALTGEGVEGTWTADAVYLSLDAGKTWTQVSGSDGKDGKDGKNGDSMFISIDYMTDKDFVTFTLASGGGVIQVSKYKGASLTLVSSRDQPWDIGESVSLDYKITYGNSSRRQIEIIAPKGWKAEIDESRHQLIITAPQMVDLSTADYEGKLIMMLNVDNDPSIIRTVDVKLTDVFSVSLSGDVAKLLNRYGYKGKSLTIHGSLDKSAVGTIEEDFEALRANTTINTLNLKGIEGLTALPDSTFTGNRTLQTVILPDGLTTIGQYAFERCEALQEIEIPANVKVIPPRAFYQCSSLRKVILPEGLERIEGGESINIDPSGPGVYWWGAFQECRQLTEINIPSTCKWIGYGTFFMSGIIASDPNQHNGELTIGKDVKIGSYCFRRSKITQLTLLSNDIIPSPNKFPPTQIFMECQDLKEVVFGDLLTHSPGDQEDFRECKTLETVWLGPLFTTIHVGMFVECKNLKSVIWPFSDKLSIEKFQIEKGEVTIIEENNKNTTYKNVSPFFRASDDFKIYVPDHRVNAMKTEFSFLEEHFAPISSYKP